MRTAPIKAHVTPTLRKWIEKFAADAGVSVSTYLERVYADHAAQKAVGRPKPNLPALIDAIPKRRKAVYLIRLNGLTKIGKSVDPQRRIKGMQLPGKPEWIYIAWSDDADGEEKRLHQFFSHSRKHGEWFDLTIEQAAQALRMLSQA